MIDSSRQYDGQTPHAAFFAGPFFSRWRRFESRVLAFSNSARREAGRLWPARLMK